MNLILSFRNNRAFDTFRVPCAVGPGTGVSVGVRLLKRARFIQVVKGFSRQGYLGDGVIVMQSSPTDCDWSSIPKDILHAAGISVPALKRTRVRRERLE